MKEQARYIALVILGIGIGALIMQELTRRQRHPAKKEPAKPETIQSGLTKEMQRCTQLAQDYRDGKTPWLIRCEFADQVIDDKVAKALDALKANNYPRMNKAYWDLKQCV